MPHRPILDPSGGFRRIPLQPHQLTKPITPAEDVFVLAHLGVPRVDPATWTLEIDGLVRHPGRYTLNELKRYPLHRVRSVHNCAGNPLNPRVPTRRIANVVWGGVELRTLLDEAGVDETASHVWSYGADYGEFNGTYCESYLKDLPLSRLDAGDVLVAYELNGEHLTAEHGFPVRLLVPGWYGTNSVKWLSRMTLADRRAAGLFTTVLYNDVVSEIEGDSPPSLNPTWEIAPDSVIVAPEPDERRPVAKSGEIWGWAWAAAGIRTVEISVDGGRTWRAAAVEPRERWSWQRLSHGNRWRPGRSPSSPALPTSAGRFSHRVVLGTPFIP
ncbi:MAG: molybdopterin-dependent oxidoreductase [Gemmatimonadales bacterium]